MDLLIFDNMKSQQPVFTLSKFTFCIIFYAKYSMIVVKVHCRYSHLLHNLFSMEVFNAQVLPTYSVSVIKFKYNKVLKCSFKKIVVKRKY